MSTEWAVESSQLSHLGKKRKHNEDYVGYFEPDQPDELLVNGRLYLVADGVGGAASGEVASRFAVQKILYDFYNSANADLEMRLVNVIEDANTDIFERNSRHAEHHEMATTLVAALIHDNRLWVANIGDSRAYLVRNQHIEQISRDHSFVELLVEEGSISPEEAKSHPARNRIMRSLGIDRRAKVDIFTRQLAADDVIVLCSDGLTRYILDAEIAQMVTKYPSDIATHRLVDLANARGGKDNISVSVIRIRPEPITLTTSVTPHRLEKPEWDTLTRPAAQSIGSPSQVAEPPSRSSGQSWFLLRRVRLTRYHWAAYIVAILLVGCAIVGWQTDLWVFDWRTGRIAGIDLSGTGDENPDNRLTLSPQPVVVQYMTATPVVTQPIPLQSAPPTPTFGPTLTVTIMPTPTHFALPDPTLTSEPTPTVPQITATVAASTTTLSPEPSPTPAVIDPLPATATAVPAEETPSPGIEHVVIISIDGLRPDALDLTDTPALDALKAAGAYSPRAKAVVPSDTMPNHASMLGGMTPDKHGILWNLLYDEAPRVTGPTLFSVAHEAGLSTVMVVGKAKLEYLVLPDSVDNFLDAGPTDTQVKDRAIEIIRTDLPTILFIHLPDVDRAGHDTGWLSPGQLQTLTVADGLIGELVAALEAGGYVPTTMLIVTSDHGGHDTGHGSDSPEDTTIPWLAVGPGIAVGMTLTSDIVTYDTAATVLYVLNLPIPEPWDGQPVLEIFE